MRWSAVVDPRNRESRAWVGGDGRSRAERTSCRNEAGGRAGGVCNQSVFRAPASRTGRRGERRGDESATATDSGFVPSRSRGEAVDHLQISRAGVATFGERSRRSRGIRPETGRWCGAVVASPLRAAERADGRVFAASPFTFGAERERRGDESRECQMFSGCSREMWWIEPGMPRDVDATANDATSKSGAPSTSAYRNGTDRSRGDAAAEIGEAVAVSSRRRGVHAAKTAGTERRRIADRRSFPLSFSRDVGAGGGGGTKSRLRPVVASGRRGRRVHLFVPWWDGGVSGRRAGRSQGW